jgi:hypothetical protein
MGMSREHDCRADFPRRARPAHRGKHETDLGSRETLNSNRACARFERMGASRIIETQELARPSAPERTFLQSGCRQASGFLDTPGANQTREQTDDPPRPRRSFSRAHFRNTKTPWVANFAGQTPAVTGSVHAESEAVIRRTVQ